MITIDGTNGITANTVTVQSQPAPGPAWYAYASVSGSAATGTNTLLFDAEDSDPSGVYTAATGLALPAVAGYYLVVGRFQATMTNLSAPCYLVIQKNGSTVIQGISSQFPLAGTATNQQALLVSGLVYCNGSTDTLSIAMVNKTAGAITYNTGSDITYFLGTLTAR
jgi:hypothetical protein